MTTIPPQHTRIAWEDRPADPRPTTWTIDPTEGAVQGPLDLAFLAGGRLDLVIPAGMMALLSDRGGLRRCFLDGIHHLTVGERTDDDDAEDPGGEPGALAPSGLLYFFDLVGELDLAWRQHLALRPSEGDNAGARPARGRFRVRIVNASAFYEAFLRDREGEGEHICRDALSHLLPTFLAIHLARTSPERIDRRDIHDQVADLDPCCLDGQLAPYGLACLGVEMSLDGAALPTALTPC